MPSPDQTGYILLSLKIGSDDAPVNDPEKVAERLTDLLAGDKDVAELELVFNDGFGRYVRYGPGSWVL